jgi:hypothetical protein
VTEVLRSTDITHLGEGLTAAAACRTAAMDRVDSVIGRYAGHIARP